MQAIRYSKGRLLRHAAFVAVFVLSCGYLMISPGHGGNIILSVLTTDFGRAFLIPALIVAGLIHLWRTLGLAFSTENALAFSDEGMRIVTGTGVKQLPWSDFKEAKVQKVRVSWTFRFRHLILKRVKGGAIRLRLDMTTAHGANEELIFELIRLSQAAAFASGKAVGPAFHQWVDGDASPGRQRPAAAPSPTGDSGFDPDAALARYLDRKKAGMLEAPPPVVSPPRASFGRKGL